MNTFLSGEEDLAEKTLFSSSAVLATQRTGNYRYIWKVSPRDIVFVTGKGAKTTTVNPRLLDYARQQLYLVYSGALGEMITLAC